MRRLKRSLPNRMALPLNWSGTTWLGISFDRSGRLTYSSGEVFPSGARLAEFHTRCRHVIARANLV